MSSVTAPLVVHIATGGNAVGGVAQHVCGLAPKLEARGFKVILVFLGEGATPEEARKQHLRVETVPKRRRADPFTLLQLSRLLKRLSPQLVHTHNLTSNFYGRIAARRAQVPHLITTVHGFMGDLLQYDKSGSLGNRFLFWHTRFTNKSIDKLVAVSERIKDWLLSTGLPPDRISVIRCGLDLRNIKSCREARRTARAQLGLTEEAWVIGNVARMDPVKNQVLLVEACLPLLRKDHNVKLAIIGEGPERSAIEVKVRAAQIEEQVLLPGLISNARCLMPAFDVLAISSRMEGIPLAMLEAMAASVPVVAAEVGSVSEVIEESVSGLLVPPGNSQLLTQAITKLYTDKLLSQRLGAAGRKAIEEKYDVEVTADLMAEVYREVLGAKRQTGSPFGLPAGAKP